MVQPWEGLRLTPRTMHKGTGAGGEVSVRGHQDPPTNPRRLLLVAGVHIWGLTVHFSVDIGKRSVIE